jgi:hypothetical protein
VRAWAPHLPFAKKDPPTCTPPVEGPAAVPYHAGDRLQDPPGPRLGPTVQALDNVEVLKAAPAPIPCSSAYS